MKVSLKNKWVKALRSGKYEQTEGALHRPACDNGGKPGYCCLGVLRRISGGTVRRTDLVNEYLEPKSCGITQTEQEKLASKNDAGESFKVIADYIERNL